MEGYKIIFDDIKKVFNILDITDEYILVKNKESTNKIYIYEIEPVTFLNFSIDVQSNILNLYSEFLRESNFKFQIYISNRKINIQKYIKNIENCISKTGSVEYVELVSKYIESIKNQLQDEKVYTTKYYLVISIERSSQSDINVVDNIISKIDNIGCNTKRITSKTEFELLLYEALNKEVVI